MKVSELASLSHMSVSVFHKHFKAVTSISPLKYQKELRLQEARNLMLSKQMDAITASQLVGYASASQFSRDYRSYFGNPPRRDMAKLHSRLTSEMYQ
ncbi:Exoenzyme S synthesis regulatory protein ExsA [compost metagenome]